MNTSPEIYAKDPRTPAPAPQFVPATAAQFAPGHRVGGPVGHYVCIAATSSAPPTEGGQSNDYWHWVG